ncbi:hypothetical protein BWQ96_08656 [Gracilariopsis chorda]|uniref:Uncharacterized protein n=1 Tax=Gracilariopsis chorda TaxID=448386 RepID=A0A2V3IHR0_9FLOR|nr:hypothetical protein BWQ96_08656 [Gracilariopsis chorda]|eukprot:PXF41645.1 hypothetical protein BWQ96_08656 [Gracilariopsis chorda]
MLPADAPVPGEEEHEAARVLLNPPLLALYALTNGVTHAAARRMLLALVAGAPSAKPPTQPAEPPIPEVLSKTYRTPVLPAFKNLIDQHAPHLVIAHVRPH